MHVILYTKRPRIASITYFSSLEDVEKLLIYSKNRVSYLTRFFGLIRRYTWFQSGSAPLL